MRDKQVKEDSVYKKYIPNAKLKNTEAWSAWLKSIVEEDEWILFTCTVVFKSVDANNTKDRFESEYRNRFLNKIRRRLESSKKNIPKAIPLECIYYYEKSEKSFGKIDSKKCPYHIHSIIPINKYQVHRFWSYDENRLNSRLFKDLNSIDVVQDVLIEPIENNDSFRWMLYITKSKSI